jgi:hypothetical protein
MKTDSTVLAFHHPDEIDDGLTREKWRDFLNTTCPTPGGRSNGKLLEYAQTSP